MHIKARTFVFTPLEMRRVHIYGVKARAGVVLNATTKAAPDDVVIECAAGVRREEREAGSLRGQEKGATMQPHFLLVGIWIYGRDAGGNCF
jgi:hypothetical protein